MWHPEAQWGRPPSTAHCSLPSRWLQNAFHELSETPSLLNALLILRGFRGALLLSVRSSALSPIECWIELKQVVIGVCELTAFLAFFFGLIFCNLLEGWVCMIAMIPNQVGIILGIPFQKFWEIKPWTLCEDLWACVGTAMPVTFL